MRCSRSAPELRSFVLAKSRGFGSTPRRSLPEKSRPLSPGLGPTLSRFRGSGRRGSLRSPWRDECLSMRSRGGNGPSGRLGRLGLPLSKIKLISLPESGLGSESGLGGTAGCGGVEAAALPAFSRLNCSLRSRISDFFDSVTVEAAGVGTWIVDLMSDTGCKGVGILPGPAVVGVAVTSPSSTSWVVGLEVEMPSELAREVGLNSGAVGLRADLGLAAGDEDFPVLPFV